MLFLHALPLDAAMDCVGTSSNPALLGKRFRHSYDHWPMLYPYFVHISLAPTHLAHHSTCAPIGDTSWLVDSTVQWNNNALFILVLYMTVWTIMYRRGSHYGVVPTAAWCAMTRSGPSPVSSRVARHFSWSRRPSCRRWSGTRFATSPPLPVWSSPAASGGERTWWPATGAVDNDRHE